MKECVKNIANGFVSPLSALDYACYVLGLIRRTILMVLRGDSKKLGYLILQTYRWRANWRERCLIDRIRRKNTWGEFRRIPAREIVFGHDVGSADDVHLQKRIAGLSKISPGELTDEVFTSICPSDGPVEVHGSVALNGNGRVYALNASGHGGYEIECADYHCKTL